MGKLISKKDVGDKIEIEIDRDGKTKKIKCGIAQRKEHEYYEKIELSVEDGDFSIIVDGEEKHFGDLDILGDLQDIRILQSEDMRESMEEVREAVEEAREELLEAQEDMEIDIWFDNDGVY